jgi:2-dehydro-3-deoxyphosphogluconate aldolase/(4S)-4-hydroxy-2-oxoglutarate aldolase
MCGWLNTSDPSQLLESLRRQPVLAVLRPTSTAQAHSQLQQLLAVGLLHVELAVQPSAAWVALARQLLQAYPGLRLGAASVRSAAALDAVLEAGLAYAVAPILDAALQRRAAEAGITLVPGVFTPTEIDLALRCGAPAVKLFPACALGPTYWPALRGALAPLPFCIAAGGLASADVMPWLSAGVDAVALGGSLFVDGSDNARLDGGLATVLARLNDGARGNVLST